MNTIRCLSVRQPYAWAICSGIKRPENRTGATDYRGLAETGGQRIVTAESFPTGVIVGAAMLVDVLPLTPELETDSFAVGPACLLFDAQKLFTDVIPFKGKLSLFNLSYELSNMVTQRYDAAAKPTVSEMQRKIASFVQDDEFDLNIWRAQSYAQLQQWEDALRCCTNAIHLKPDDAVALRMHAFCNFELGRYDDGLVDVNTAMALIPDEASILWVRSEIYRCMGNMEASIADYNRAIELNPAIAEPDDSSGDSEPESA